VRLAAARSAADAVIGMVSSVGVRPVAVRDPMGDVILRQTGLGVVTVSRSPGWKPGDTGHDNEPAIHAG
jgi:hypothetical protein